MQASRASSIQDPSDLVSLPPVEPVALGQTDIDVDEPTVLEVLTDFPEATFERADLPGVSELLGDPVDAEKLPQIEAIERHEPIRPPPDWCVDIAGEIMAMTTFELWMALARGDVDGNTRVWGNGMDNWEFVSDIPELSHALSNSLSLAPPPPVIPTPTGVHSVRTHHEPTPLGFGTTDAANDDHPAQSGPVPRRKPRITFERVTWAVGGLAAAAVALLALVPQTTESSAATGAPRVLAVARLEAAMERANRQVDEARQRRLEREAARALAPVPASSARQHKEVGQRRTRRSHH